MTAQTATKATTGLLAAIGVGVAMITDAEDPRLAAALSALSSFLLGVCVTLMILDWRRP